MIKQWKKAISFVITISIAVLIICSAMTFTAYAKDTAKISVGSGSCDVGDEVSISVSVSSSVDIYMCDIWLSYDAGILQPVSGYSGGGGGSVRLLSTDGTSFTVKFKAVAAGNSSISVNASNTIISSADEDYMAVSAGSGSVTVKAPVTYSTDNTLVSLEINPGVLSPAFSPNVTSYTTTVGSDCAQLVVSAIANDSNASVSVRGTRMDPGSNTTTITVTAQDGSKKVYTIYTTKDDSAETPKETEAETKAGEEATAEETEKTPEQQRTVKIEDAQYQILDDFEANPLPSGYEAIDYEYNETAVKAGKGVNTKLVLMYLENSDGKGTSGFYIYDSVSKTFSLYREVGEPDITYVILPITDSMEKPDGYQKTSYAINGNTVDVLMDTDGTYCLFYGVSSLGVTGWFRYDCNDGTIQGYSAQSTAAVHMISEETAGNEEHTVWSVWKIAALVFAAAAVVLIVVVIVLSVNLSKNKRAFAAAAGGSDYDDDYDDYDYGGYEEDDDEEIEQEDDDEMVRSISDALAKGHDDELELLEIDDVDEIKRT